MNLKSQLYPTIQKNQLYLMIRKNLMFLQFPQSPKIQKIP
jgi:hypothetical protein